MHFVLGNQDEYYQGSDAEALKNDYVDLGFKVHAYEGIHDIDSKIVAEIFWGPFHGISNPVERGYFLLYIKTILYNCFI